MARLLLVSPIHTTTLTLVFVVLSVFSIISVITFLCGSKNMRRETDEKKGFKENKLISKINSSRAVSMVKMLSWRKVRAEGGDEEEEGDYSNKQQDDEEALWRKNILMGEKCRPLDFSGKSVHDSQGKLVIPHQDALR